MKVIINEFEVVPESRKVEQPTKSAVQAEQKAPPTLRPEDITRIMQRQRLRLERIRAD